MVWPRRIRNLKSSKFAMVSNRGLISKTQVALLLVLALAVSYVEVVKAFSPVAVAGYRGVKKISPTLFAGDDEAEGAPAEDTAGGSPPIPRAAPAPPAVKPKRLDPLLASLTRVDPGAMQGGKTTTVPFLGEIPADGSMVVLAPAAGIAVLGFLYSIVIAFNSSDEIVNALYQVSDDISQTATNKANMVYDDSVCRGLCSSQEESLEGMRSFMSAISGK